MEIPAETCPGQSDVIRTAEYANLMIVDAGLSDDVVHDFVAAIFEQLDTVHAIHPSAEAISLENALTGLSVPLHPGALRYFEGQGIAIPDRLRP